MARLIRTEKEVEGRYTEQWIVVEEDALEQVMDVVYTESRAALGKQRKDVLRLAGLS